MSSPSETKISEKKKVSFEHEMGFITTRIEVQLPNGGSVGTAFIFRVDVNDGSDKSLLLLLSNKHVFVDPSHQIRIIFNRKDEAGNPKYGNFKEFNQRGFEHIYYAHPDADVDLACINISGIAHPDIFFKHITKEFLQPIDYQKVALASQVIFVGYPVGYYDKVNNLPIARSGVIASMPDVDFCGKGQLVIDAHIFQGSSGSPVFVSVDSKYRLLGVLSQAVTRSSALRALPASMHPLGIQEAVGLGIVIKQRHVQELVDYAVSEYIKNNQKQ